MRVYLIRHAQAGDRTAGGRDIYRALTVKGRARADELAALLGDQPIVRVLSSPASRCVQTVTPLATALGLEVDEHTDLFEGARIDDALALLESGAEGDIVISSHGDIIPTVVERVAASGATVHGRGCEKGSLWILDRVEGQWRQANYLNRAKTDLPARP